MTEQRICENCLHVNAATDVHMMRKGKKSSEKNDDGQGRSGGRNGCEKESVSR